MVLPPVNTPALCLPSGGTTVIVIMLPQQSGAPKRRTITLVEDFKFHTRAMGGNRTWGAMDKVLIEEAIYNTCACSKASIHPKS